MSNTINWVFWLVALGINGFVIFLWVIFGLAGSGSMDSPQARGLIWGTVLGVGLPLLRSMHFMTKERFASAITTTLAFVPLSMVFTVVMIGVFKLAADAPGSLTLVVSKWDHMAYLIKLNGFDGTSSVFGGANIAECIMVR